jgi:hypothetical protein
MKYNEMKNVVQAIEDQTNWELIIEMAKELYENFYYATVEIRDIEVGYVVEAIWAYDKNNQEIMLDFSMPFWSQEKIGYGETHLESLNENLESMWKKYYQYHMQYPYQFEEYWREAVKRSICTSLPELQYEAYDGERYYLNNPPLTEEEKKKWM